MAGKQKLIYTGDPPRTHVETHKCKYIWGIDDAVTWFNYSVYDDVLLVQYLLNKAGYSEPLVLDGIFGRKTYRAIRRFQSEFKYCYVDRRVDPYKGRIVSTKSNTVYTILHLNDALLWHNPIYFKDISSDPDCPAELAVIADSATVS